MNFSLYGLIIGIALVLAFSLAERILVWHHPSKKGQVSLDWLLASTFFFGLVGARLYHVATDWTLYQSQPLRALFVWQGGLGIYGAVAGGLLGIILWQHFFRPPWKLLEILDAAFIALPFAQALGRWGNFVNQELYGRPTNAPWGIFIDPINRFPGYESVERYHPLFLYESVTSLAIGLALFLIWRQGRKVQQVEFLRLGSGLFVGLYGLWYGTARFSLEFLRLETAPGPFGISVAQWVSLALVAIGLGMLARAAGRQKKALFGTLVLLFLFLLPPSAARAQQTAPYEFSLTPSVVEISIKPGKQVTQAFLLENSGSLDWEVTPVLRDFSSDGQTGQPVLQETTSFPYATLQNSDISLYQPFPLKANSSQQIVLGVDIPDDAPQRDWYVTLLFLTSPADAQNRDSTGAQARGTIGANLLIRVTNTNLTPLSWEINLKLPKLVDSLQTLIVRPFITNTSVTSAAPDLGIVILDWRDQIVYEREGLPDRVLAKSSREIFAAQQRKDDPRSFAPMAFAFDPLFGFGPYRVRATIRNAQGGPVVTEEEVIAFPFSLILAAVVFGSVIAVNRLRRKRLVKSLEKPTDQ